MAHPIVTDESSFFASVAKLLDAPSTEVTPSERPIVEELVRLRADLSDAKGEDRGAILEQYHAQVSLLEQLRGARGRPQVDPLSPYFAHMRLREDVKGKVRERDVCLGNATRIEPGLRVVDWRHAPVSRIFYQNQQGDSYEEELGGRVVEGRLLTRRTVAIRGGRLEAIYAPEGVFQRAADPGEGSPAAGVWQQVSVDAPRLAGGAGAALHWHREGSQGRNLGSDRRGVRRRTDRHLPDIAGLIDPEQFELISRPEGFLVIRGSAGSGKTTVALHRIAWLAHGDGRVNSGRTLFLVFSRALRDYVSHVLPALGVGQVNIRTFRDWAGHQRQRHYPRLPQRHRYDTPAVIVALKSHPAMLQALSWQVKRTPAPPTPAQAVDDWFNALTNPTLLAEAVAATATGAFTPDELQEVAVWCSGQHTDWLEWQQERRGDRGHQGDLFGQPSMGKDFRLLDEEDDSLLLYAWQLRVGPLRVRKKRPLRLLHVAVDEVQDFSPVDVRVVLGCLDQRQSITLAGDTQQHVMKDAGFTSWSDFFRHLGVDGAAVETLRVSYRCTQQVVEFAMDVLGPLREDDLPMVTRSGPQVELFSFTNHGACVSFLADTLNTLADREPNASVAILAPTRELSDIYFRGLRQGDVPRLRQVTKQDFAFAPGVEVTEVAEVKGLEFDYVVLVEVSRGHYPETAAARRLLHVGATRAIHQLWLTSVAPSSPLILAGNDM